MNENRHEKFAQEIKVLFEKEFDGFFPEDFDKISKILEAKIWKGKSGFADFCENLSDEERREVDFMMGM
ncbi:MAG: hypothetical protein R2941_24545 [Desulfobacterales bacterium]